MEQGAGFSLCEDFSRSIEPAFCHYSGLDARCVNQIFSHSDGNRPPRAIITTNQQERARYSTTLRKSSGPVGYSLSFVVLASSGLYFEGPSLAIRAVSDSA